jgi:hypothetical protein
MKNCSLMRNLRLLLDEVVAVDFLTLNNWTQSLHCCSGKAVVVGAAVL